MLQVGHCLGHYTLLHPRGQPSSLNTCYFVGMRGLVLQLCQKCPVVYKMDLSVRFCKFEDSLRKENASLPTDVLIRLLLKLKLADRVPLSVTSEVRCSTNSPFPSMPNHFFLLLPTGRLIRVELVRLLLHFFFNCFQRARFSAGMSYST